MFFHIDTGRDNQSIIEHCTEALESNTPPTLDPKLEYVWAKVRLESDIVSFIFTELDDGVQDELVEDMREVVEYDIADYTGCKETALVISTNVMIQLQRELY